MTEPGVRHVQVTAECPRCNYPIVPGNVTYHVDDNAFGALLAGQAIRRLLWCAKLQHLGRCPGSPPCAPESATDAPI